MVAVKQTLLGVDRYLHTFMTGQSGGQFLRLGAPRSEWWGQRRAAPKENPHVHPAARLDEQVFERLARLLVEDEVGLHVPPGEVHEGTRRSDGLADRVEGLFTIDVDGEGVPRPLRRMPGDPGCVTWLERSAPSELGQPSPMMAPKRPFEAVPKRAVHPVYWVALVKSQPAPSDPVTDARKHIGCGRGRSDGPPDPGED